MKRLLSYSSILFLASVVLAGCQQEPQSANGPQGVLPLKSSPPPAKPALTWTYKVSSKGKMWDAIHVMDTDAGHPTVIVQAASTSLSYGMQPGWSPNGGSIGFTQSASGAPDTIKAVDVSVNSSGVPVGSNIRIILGLPSTSMHIGNPYWSSTSSVGKIAYTSSGGPTTSLWVISQSGGTPTEVFRADTNWARFSTFYSEATWSPDDSRLAVLRWGPSVVKIMIFNTTTTPWSYVDSITAPGDVFGMEWSRSGSMNKLAFGSREHGSAVNLYYCTPTTNPTDLETSGDMGWYPTWSPNNSSVMNTHSALYKNIPFTSSSTEISSAYFYSVKWKR